MQISRKLSAALLGAVFLAACGDADRATGPISEAGAPGSAAMSPAESPVGDVAHALALALQDQGLRQRLKNDMRRSPFPEHKLDVAAYLRGQSGGIVLAKMAQATGRTRADLLALLDRAGPLEMYFSIPAHRETWTGGADLQVLGSTRAEGQFATAYTTSGTPVSVLVATVPATPTLVVVPQETDFSDPPDMSTVRNVRDRGGQSIGTYMNPGDCIYPESTGPGDVQTLSCGGEPIGEPTPPPTPTYRYRSSLGWGQMERLLEYKQAYHLESNWLLQGDPELYVVVTSHAAMPTDATKPLFQSRVRFGAGKPDNTNWHTISVDLIRWNQEYGNFMNLKFYEADGTAFTTGTLTFAGKTYGYTYPHENDDLGNWTYSFNDAALVNGYSGHGVNKWGANTGSLTFISDYLIP